MHPAGDIIITGSHGITIRGRSLTVTPALVKNVTAERLCLGPGIPTWRDGALLSQTRLVFRALINSSVKIYTADGTVYQKNRDYLLHRHWAKLCLASGSRLKPGQEVLADYRYRLSRIDLVQADKHGRVSLKTGKYSLTCPLLPRPDKGCVPVASIYLAPEADRIKKGNIYIIRPQSWAAAGTSRFYPQRTLEKLRRGEKVTIVAFGDSITNYGDASCRARSWFGLFTTYLAHKYPRAQITMINAGVGGNSTDDAVKRVRSDVIAHQPDLVTVAFGVNDENGEKGSGQNTVPLPRYRVNLLKIIRQVQMIRGDIILMTPTLKNPGWIHTSGMIGKYAGVMRRLTREERLGLADVTRAWQALKYQGIPFITYLSTCINHPNDHGHRVIFEQLLTLFK